MQRRLAVSFGLVAALFLAACQQASNELPIPNIEILNGGTSSVSPQFGALGGGIPDGRQVTFVDDVVVLRGVHFRPDMKAFLGLNIQLAYRPDSLMTTDRFRLPDAPFVYSDPVTGQKTVLEVEVPIEYSREGEVRIGIPASVACSAAMTNPIVRLYGDSGSSVPTADVYHVVGPRAIALTPRQGLDLGDYSVTLHGDFFSPYTQIAIRYLDPADGLIKVVGDSVADDITEEFVDRHTLIVPNWPGWFPT